MSFEFDKEELTRVALSGILDPYMQLLRKMAPERGLGCYSFTVNVYKDTVVINTTTSDHNKALQKQVSIVRSIGKSSKRTSSTLTPR